MSTNTDASGWNSKTGLAGAAVGSAAIAAALLYARHNKTTYKAAKPPCPEPPLETD